MAGYLLDGPFVSELHRLLRWWRQSRYENHSRRSPGRQPLAHQIARFELTADLTPGGTATGVRREWLDGELTDADPEHEDTLRDILGTTRGKARDTDASPRLDGTHVIASKAHDHVNWDIVHAQPWPLLVRGQLTGDLATTDASFEIDGVIILQPVGAISVTHILTSGELTVHNVFSWEGDENGEVMAEWNENNTRWEAINVECPE